MSVATSGVLMLLWVLTSYTSHYYTRRFFTDWLPPHSIFLSMLYSVSTLTFIQVIFFFICTTKVDDRADSINSARAKSLIFSLFIACHSLATFSTNFSFVFMDTASSLVVKMMEPLTSAVLCQVITGTPHKPSIWLALFVVVVGASGFVHDRFDFQVGVGTIFALLSNCLNGLRNFTLKHLIIPSDMSLRAANFSSYLPHIVSSVLVTLVMLSFLQCVGCMSLAYAAFAAVSHTLYTYISTCMLLKVLSVVSHSLAGIMKRVAVVSVFLVVSPVAGSSLLTIRHVACLAMCAGGLLIYTRSLAVADNKTEIGKKKDIYRHTYRAVVLVSVFVVVLVSLGVTAFSCSDKSTSPGSAYSLDQGTSSTSSLGHHFGIRGSMLGFRALHVDVFRQAIAGRTHVALYDMLRRGNKHEGMYTVGLLNVLAELPVEIAEICGQGNCPEDVDAWRRKIDTSLIKNITVILRANPLHPSPQLVKTLCRVFPNNPLIVLTQTIFIDDDSSSNDSEDCINVSFVIHSENSRRNVADVFGSRVKTFLVPSLSFSINSVKKVMSPITEVTWLLPRKHPNVCNQSTILSTSNELPLPVRCLHRDLDMDWPVPKGLTLIENANILTYSSMLFSSMGKTLVIDRLAGHVAALALGKTHVLLLNRDRELREHWETWGKSSSSCVSVYEADSPQQAMDRLHADRQHEQLSPAVTTVRKFWY